MNRLSKNNKDEEIKVKASQWVARAYSGNASQADEEALSAWLEADDRHRREYMRTLEVWDASGQMGLEETISSESKDISTPNWRGYAAIAAVLVVAFVGTMISFSSTTVPNGEIEAPFNGDSTANTIQAYTTAVGETRELTLADGSIVTLNTGSKIYVDFTGNMRRAILDSGEAFFDVTKDPSRPFVVTAGDQSVTVLGTRFNVFRQGPTLTVAVVEGVVAVHDNLEPEKLEENARLLVEQPMEELETDFRHYRLEAGSVGTFEKSVELQGDVEIADAEVHQSWRQGVLKFSESSLLDVVEKLSRYSDAPIVLSDTALSELSISGVFHHHDLEGILAGMEALLPITVTRENDQIIISPAG